MIVAVGSWRGRGATTTAVILAQLLRRLVAPGDVVLVEADPAGGVLRARLGGRGAAAPGPDARGLEALAFPVDGSAGRSVRDRVLDAASVRLGGVYVVTAPGNPFHAWACHRPRTDWVGALAMLDALVVVDIGRLRGGAPSTALAAAAQALVLVSDDDVVSLSTSLDWVAAGGRMSPAETGTAWRQTGLVVVEGGPTGERVRPGDLRAAAGPVCLGRLPFAPATAAAFDRGADCGERRWQRDRLVRAVEHLAARLLDSLAIGGISSATDVPTPVAR